MIECMDICKLDSKDTLTADEYRQMVLEQKHQHNGRHYPEQALQEYLCEKLEQAMRAGAKIYYFAVPNGEKRGADAVAGARIGDRLRKQGVKAGVSDLVVLVDGGQAIFVEMKASKGCMSNNQKMFEKQVEALGFSYIVLNDYSRVDDFISAITHKTSIEVLSHYLLSLHKKNKKNAKIAKKHLTNKNNYI